MSVHLLVHATEARSIPARFRTAGATEPGKAMTWAPNGKLDDPTFKSLVERGALVEIRHGLWYLNEEKLVSAGAVQAGLFAAALGAAALTAAVPAISLAR